MLHVSQIKNKHLAAIIGEQWDQLERIEETASIRTVLFVLIDAVASYLVDLKIMLKIIL